MSIFILRFCLYKPSFSISNPKLTDLQTKVLEAISTAILETNAKTGASAVIMEKICVKQLDTAMFQ